MTYRHSARRELLDLVKYPILTEKTIQLLEKNKYSFAVDRKADKSTLKAAVEKLFNVKVLSINTSLLPSKKRRVRKFIGTKARYKRAIVELSASDSITFFDE